MTLTRLRAAPAVVQLHGFAAMAAMVLRLAQFVAPKGTRRHRGFGWAWVVLMVAVAVSSFGITGLFTVMPGRIMHRVVFGG